LRLSESLEPLANYLPVAAMLTEFKNQFGNVVAESSSAFNWS